MRRFLAYLISAAVMVLFQAAYTDATYRRCGVVVYPSAYHAPAVVHHAAPYEPLLAGPVRTTYNVFYSGIEGPALLDFLNRTLDIRDKELSLMLSGKAPEARTVPIMPSAMGASPFVPKKDVKGGMRLEVGAAVLTKRCASCHTEGKTEDAAPVFFGPDGKALDVGDSFERMAKAIYKRTMPPSGMSDADRVESLGFLQFTPPAAAAPVPATKE